MDRPNLTVLTRALGRQGAHGRHPGHRGRGRSTPKGSRRRVSAGEVILCGGAFNSPAAAAAVGDRRRRPPAQRRRGCPCTTCPASARTCRTTSRCTCSTRPSSRCRSTRTSSCGSARSSAPSGCSCGQGPGASNHFEGGGFARSNDEVDYPNLMFHFLPIAVRYDGTAPAGGHGYQVHIGPMYSDARGRVRITSADPTAAPSILFNYLSTDQDRREWVEAVAVARDILAQPAFAPYDGGEISPGPEVEHARADPRVGAARRRDRLPPFVHLPDGRRRDGRRRPPDDAGARHRGPARGGCLGHALRDQCATSTPPR